MQITRQHLIEWSACKGVREWFDANYPSGEGEYVAVQLALQADNRRDYSNWLSWKVVEHWPEQAAALECAFCDALVQKLIAEAEASQDDASSLAASGNDSSLAASGNDSSLAASGLGSTVTMGPGGCAAVAYHDGARVRFAVAYVGEDGIEAGVTYRVNGKGEFVEVQL